jgi:hypothetical protein
LKSLFVMVTGVAPGIGKTTLAAGLVARASTAGLHAEPFEEGQIFTRPAFARFGRAFRDRSACPTAAMMLDAYMALVGELGPNAAVVFDWSCLGMVSDLPWAEGRPDVLLRHARDVFELAQPLRPALLYLTGDIEVALARAAAERGERWIRRYGAAGRRRPPDGPRSPGGHRGVDTAPAVPEIGAGRFPSCRVAGTGDRRHALGR